VAILGGDYDELLSDASHPALSGILTPAQQIGYQAAKLLHQQIQGKKVLQKDTFITSGKVVERLSTEVLAIDDPQTLQAIQYLQAHACENITVDDILRKVPMARRALERKFKSLLGRSPAKEICHIRIQRARKLLAETNLSMQDIAEACGYTSYTYLGNVFKKETGISPGLYRKEAMNYGIKKLL
jgi:LacI family transcriptional regulator